jgi:hypothetical protein
MSGFWQAARHANVTALTVWGVARAVESNFAYARAAMGRTNKIPWRSSRPRVIDDFLQIVDRSGS